MSILSSVCLFGKGALAVPLAQLAESGGQERPWLQVLPWLVVVVAFSVLLGFIIAKWSRRDADKKIL